MLLLVSTPIGNLGDLSARAAEALTNADIIACEDTRQTRKLLSLCSLSSKAEMVSYHDYNGSEMRPKLLAALKAGKFIVLVSDAGTPLISDPGYKLVEACHQAGITISAAPGPTAAIMALTLSGLPSDRFCFQGFVANKITAARAQIIETVPLPMTQIWFEVPRRLAATLALMEDIYGDRIGFIARELTKRYETLDRASLLILKEKYASLPAPKGELVLVIQGANVKSTLYTQAEVEAMLMQALSRTSLKDAVKETETLTGWSRRQVYQIALELEKNK